MRNYDNTVKRWTTTNQLNFMTPLVLIAIEMLSARSTQRIHAMLAAFGASVETLMYIH